MFWCFAKVNNRLAEIYVEKRNNKPFIFGHCYVRKEEYQTKKEQQTIKEDSTRFVFTYRRGKYQHIKTATAGIVRNI